MLTNEPYCKVLPTFLWSTIFPQNTVLVCQHSFVWTSLDQ